MESPLVLLELKNSRDSEEPVSAMEQVFAALSSGGGHGGFLQNLFGPKHGPRFFSFEVVSVNARIHFFVGVAQKAQSYLESQLTAHYPKLLLTPFADYAPHFFSLPHVGGQLAFTNAYYYPLRTYKDVKDLDLMASVLGQMAKLPMGEAIAVQIRITPAGTNWQHSAAAVVARGIPDLSATVPRTKPHPHARLIETKIAQPGFTTSVRLMAVAPTPERAKDLLYGVGGTFGVYTLGEGNGLTVTEPAFWQKKKFESAFVARSADTAPRHQVLNTSELASLWHPPGLSLAMIKNISWGATLTGEAPENLPVAIDNEQDEN